MDSSTRIDLNKTKLASLIDVSNIYFTVKHNNYNYYDCKIVELTDYTITVMWEASSGNIYEETIFLDDIITIGKCTIKIEDIKQMEDRLSNLYNQQG